MSAMRRSISAVRLRVVKGWCKSASLFMAFMAEQAPHRAPAGFCRVLLRELYLHSVMAGFAERIDFALLLPGFQHIVELLVGRIQRKFLCLLFTGYGNKNNQYDGENADEDPVTFPKLHNHLRKNFSKNIDSKSS